MANRKLTEVFLGGRKIQLIIVVESDGVDRIYMSLDWNISLAFLNTEISLRVL